MDETVIIERPWCDPLDAARPFADEPGLLLLFTPDGWTYLARQPERVLTVRAGDAGDPFADLREGLGPRRAARADGPPFQGGWAGLMCYEFGAWAEPVALDRLDGWPDLACGLYRSLAAFHPQSRRVLAIGQGETAIQAQARAGGVIAGLARSTGAAAPQGPLAEVVEADSGDAYEATVESVKQRIARGEIFQANLARRWRARLAPGAGPFTLFERLSAASPAPFAGYLRLEDRAVVSNSPERFIRITPGPDGAVAVAEPIKGTRPRGADPAADRALAEALQADPKDRAENLMIVDLMRNDLARVAHPGGVTAPTLFALKTFANVHHLVSTISARLLDGAGPAETIRAAFPPGSITGAPKVQAMKTIAALEPPRGPYCGSLFWAGFDGAMDSSVLIRTLGCVRSGDHWRVEAGAGAGLTSDSDPHAERLETEAKIAAILQGLRGAAA
ncbi:MAG TPA: anthranilate synthase component I family protein [Caulobacteraceae bacterium]|nr:anthranilate synthase component I family protein [Caulobacteraceae bacterium]